MCVSFKPTLAGWEERHCCTETIECVDALTEPSFYKLAYVKFVCVRVC